MAIFNRATLTQQPVFHSPPDEDTLAAARALAARQLAVPSPPTTTTDPRAVQLAQTLAQNKMTVDPSISMGASSLGVSPSAVTSTLGVQPPAMTPPPPAAAPTPPPEAMAPPPAVTPTGPLIPPSSNPLAYHPPSTTQALSLNQSALTAAIQKAQAPKPVAPTPVAPPPAKSTIQQMKPPPQNQGPSNPPPPHEAPPPAQQNNPPQTDPDVLANQARQKAIADAMSKYQGQVKQYEVGQAVAQTQALPANLQAQAQALAAAKSDPLDPGASSGDGRQTAIDKAKAALAPQLKVNTPMTQIDPAVVEAQEKENAKEAAKDKAKEVAEQSAHDQAAAVAAQGNPGSDAKALQDQFQSARAKALLDARARAGFAGMGLSGAATGLESDIGRQFARDEVLAQSDLKSKDLAQQLAAAQIASLNQSTKIEGQSSTAAEHEYETETHTDVDGDGVIGDPKSQTPDAQKTSRADFVSKNFTDSVDLDPFFDANTGPGTPNQPYKITPAQKTQMEQTQGFKFTTGQNKGRVILLDQDGNAFIESN